MEPVRGLVAVQEALKTEPHDPEMLQIQKILQNLDRLHFALAGTQNKDKASSALANVSLPPLEGELSLPVVLLLLVSGLLLLVVATYAFQKLELRLGFQSPKSNDKSV
jgi:hypothetical protein